MARTKAPPARTKARPDARATLDAMAPPQAGQEPEPLLGIAALAREFGVSTRTIRFYEDKGLLSPARAGTQRVYTRRDRARLALILRAKTLGSSLTEIRHYLDLYGHCGEGRGKQLEFVVERTTAAMAALEEKKAQLDNTLAELRLIREAALRQLRERRGR
jgi:DNA-binding transcriptional MerR regulator